MFDVEGIPTFVLVEGATGKIISKNARGSITSDPEGEKFPWLPAALSTIDEAGGSLNETACFVYIDPSISAQQIASLSAIAEEYKKKW